MSLTVQVELVDNETHYVFSGHIDEEAKFPNLKDAQGPVVVDLEGVRAINSVGIRTWMMWLKSDSQSPITFVGCPKAVVMQMNMVEGFLPRGAYVRSFFVPYYCESCDEEVDALFTVGKEIKVQGGDVKIDFDSSKLCEDGQPAELDANESKYFRFLLKMGVANSAA